MFSHLHTHSQYSILDSSASIEALVEAAAALQLPSLALTDQGNLYGAVEFYKACKKEKIKPILGIELFVAPASRLEKKKSPQGYPSGFSLVLLAKNLAGYHHLCRLSTIAHLEGFYYTPRIDRETLSSYHEELVCLTGDLKSRLAFLILQNKLDEIEEEILFLKGLFKEDLYFELQRHSMKEEDIKAQGIDAEPWLLHGYKEHIQKQQVVEKVLIEKAKKYQIDLVATNDVHYLAKEDWKAHEILLNIGSGEPCEIWEKDSYGNLKTRIPNPKREVRFTHELYFKSPSVMQQLFADLPEAIQNTQKIANSCFCELDFKSKYYPVYIPPSLRGKSYTTKEREAAAAVYLRELCQEGVRLRYTEERLQKVQEKYPNKDPMDVVKERMEYELKLILSKGMGDYILIVWDFIHWAKSQGIPMGPGRGSGAGSIILFLIGITDIEPLRFNLFFERFINPERLSYPDIDVDICMDRRSEVIDYTMHTYGKDKVAQIITFGTMKARMAIKDVGRVLSIPLAKVNHIAKLVPEELNITISKALDIDPELAELYAKDPEVKQVIDLAKKLEGSVRNIGVHAAGLIIGARPLIELIPLCAAKDAEMAITQYSMKPVEAVGMLKIDFLGLKTLTSVQCAVNAIYKTRGIAIDWVNLPLEDQETFRLLNQGKTMGVFQMESAGMQELARQLHIDKFEEIIAVVSLYRPGPMEMIPSFVQRKHRKEEIEIDHPLMKDILEETYGIMVYQEQVMQIASRLAGYSLGEGDVLRRAMGKKDRDEMARQREKFKDGAKNNGIDEATALRIFDKVEKFASYGFNKSHAAAYGYLAYVTAYLKANYPKEWMAALMTCDRDDLSKVTKIIHECQAMNIAILSPDINESDKQFIATQQGVRFALTAIKGIGEAVVDAILMERQKRSFSSLFDFIQRIDPKKVGEKGIEQFIEAGCFDFTGWSRDAMLESLDAMIEKAQRENQEKEKGIISLFSLMPDKEENPFENMPKVIKPRSRQQLLQKEKEILGFYLNGHPLDEYKDKLQRLSCVTFSDLFKLQGPSVVRCACIIEEVSTRISSKNQKKFAILTLSDGLERLELPVWSDIYEEKSHLLKENELIYIVIQLDIDKGGDKKWQCKWITDLASVDDEVLAQCDEAYDKAKAQKRNNPYKEKYKIERMTKKENSPQKLLIHLKIDADTFQMSTALHIKELFKAHSGSYPAILDFYSGSQAIGSIHVDADWGVDWNTELENKLRLIPAVQDIQSRPLLH